MWIRNSFWPAIATVSKAAAALTLNKLVAISGGPVALVLLGNFMSFFQIASSLAIGAIANGVIKYLAEHHGDTQRQGRYLVTACAIALTCSAVLAAGILAYRDSLASLLHLSPQDEWVLAAVSVGLLLIAGYQLTIATLNGLNHIRTLVLVSVTADLAVITIAIAATPKLGYVGAMMAIAGGPMLAFAAVSIKILYSRPALLQPPLAPPSLTTATALGGYSLMALTSFLVVPATQLAVRNHLANHIGMFEAGLWQGLWYFSDAYIGLITATCAVILLPMYSRRQSRSELRALLRSIYAILLPGLAALSVVIYILRDTLITLLFSREFGAMSDLFGIQLAGGMLRMAAWVLGFLLVAQARIKAFILSEVAFSVIFYGLAVVLTDRLGIYGMPIAYCINHGLYFLFLLVYFRGLLQGDSETEVRQ